MKPKKLFLAMGAIALALSGPCFPNDYFSTVAASAGVSIISAVLSDVVNTILPPVST